jgi:hypothetical protein
MQFALAWLLPLPMASPTGAPNQRSEQRHQAAINKQNGDADSDGITGHHRGQDHGQQ